MLQKQIWDPPRCELPAETSDEERRDVRKDMGKLTIGDVRKDMGKLAIGFDVKNAVLFPPEVEKGLWPENYSLSDHAPLTVVFSPRRMPCSQPIF